MARERGEREGGEKRERRERREGKLVILAGEGAISVGPFCCEK